jgi:hypothetical protein
MVRTADDFTRHFALHTVVASWHYGPVVGATGGLELRGIEPLTFSMRTARG